MKRANLLALENAVRLIRAAPAGASDATLVRQHLLPLFSDAALNAYRNGRRWHVKHRIAQRSLLC